MTTDYVSVGPNVRIDATIDTIRQNANKAETLEARLRPRRHQPPARLHQAARPSVSRPDERRATSCSRT